MTTDADEPFDPVQPDDPEQQTRYLRQVQWRYPDETRALDATALENAVKQALKLCPPLKINDPKEVLRFLALVVLLTPEQKRSVLLGNVVYRILLASDGWGARKRLDFIYKFVVGRAPPDPEPDFGVWFIADPRYCPPVTPDDLAHSILSPVAIAS